MGVQTNLLIDLSLAKGEEDRLPRTNGSPFFRTATACMSITTQATEAARYFEQK